MVDPEEVTFTTQFSGSIPMTILLSSPSHPSVEDVSFNTTVVVNIPEKELRYVKIIELIPEAQLWSLIQANQPEMFEQAFAANQEQAIDIIAESEDIVATEYVELIDDEYLDEFTEIIESQEARVAELQAVADSIVSGEVPLEDLLENEELQSGSVEAIDEDQDYAEIAENNFGELLKNKIDN